MDLFKASRIISTFVLFVDMLQLGRSCRLSGFVSLGTGNAIYGHSFLLHIGGGGELDGRDGHVTALGSAQS